jgi:hypothetical protein
MKRTGATISELARMLTGPGVLPGKVIGACPDSDPAKSGLVHEMMAANHARINLFLSFGLRLGRREAAMPEAGRAAEACAAGRFVEQQ